MARRRRALMAQAKEIPVFHWDKSLGTSGLTIVGTATSPSIDSTGLKIPYGSNWKYNCIEIQNTALNKLRLEVDVSGFDYSRYTGDITFLLCFNGVYSRLLYNCNTGRWALSDGSTSTVYDVTTIKANFSIECEYNNGVAKWYVDKELVGYHNVGSNPPDNRVFAAEASVEKNLYLTRIDVWRC